jgi:ABC-type Fe3+/spermidine/putrescine transport system ATPase subunit
VNAGAEPRVRLEALSHRFGAVVALSEIELAIADGEFLTLLGPSGCGKTTLLRIVAGFERPTTGRVLLGGEDVTDRPAHRRATNMVFQRATLFPHLDVFGNVAFGLRVAGIGRAEQRERVRNALALVRLEGYEHRRSHELSGGQMQRIALARALVNRPQVLLLDEPLSALDLKIRLDMEVELRRVHRETGATFVYVTHDQREAMALSDRIVVMNAGGVEQVGAPAEVYGRPSSTFAAHFVGDANVLPVEIVGVSGDDVSLTIAERNRQVTCAGAQGGPAWLVLRPEAVRVARLAREPAADELAGVVRDVAFRGTGFQYRIGVDALETELKVEAPASSPELAVDERVTVDWSASACWLIPRDDDKQAAGPPLPAKEETPA